MVKIGRAAELFFTWRYLIFSKFVLSLLLKLMVTMRKWLSIIWQDCFETMLCIHCDTHRSLAYSQRDLFIMSRQSDYLTGPTMSPFRFLV